MQIQHVTELARLAQALGAGVVRIFTAYEHPALGPAGTGANGRATHPRVRARARPSCGVTIGVQNHHDIAAGYESLADLIETVGEPNCRALLRRLGAGAARRRHRGRRRGAWRP